ncbi:MAG: serine acetyltransferase [Dissulfurispiraceae bacterium]|jgi:serine O-acetyltransferase
MKTSIDREMLPDYVSNQLMVFFPDGKNTGKTEIRKYLALTLDRTEYCFSRINVKYFRTGEEIFFNHLHGDHYAMFLYFLSNTLYKNNCDENLCAKIFQLNRYLHSIDVYYEVQLPDIFLFVHPLGTVLGRAEYSDFFMVYQHCNVGSNRNIYPVLKKYVSMHPGSSILGNCIVEENCRLAAGSLLLDRRLEKNSLYIGNPGQYVIKTSSEINPVWC